MKSQTREVQYFLFSQYFSDGLRITLGVLLPCLLFVQLGHFEVGLVLSLGALCVSITDFPGPVIHKRNAMLACCLLIFLVALITGFVRQNSYLLAAEIGLFCFFFSMFTVYGNRAATVGTAALVIMILSIDQELEPSQVVGYSALVLAGGIWYMLLSLVLIRMRPYRQAQQALGECTHEVSKYLRLRAGFYQTGTDLETLYEKVVRQQVVVHEKQDAVREVLFKDPQLFKNPTGISRTLILTFVDLMDLYEQITTTHYDYGSMREKFGRTGILGEIATQILRIADQLDAIGFAIQANTRLRGLSDLQQPLEELKKRIDTLGENEKEGSTLALKKIFVNVRNLVQRLNDIRQYYTQPPGTLHQPVEFSRFVTHQDFDPKLFRHNLTFNSAIFKHSFRVALVCLIGYAVTKIAPYGNHSYWVLLTIIVILKPAFSLTKQRNNQRIIGTLAGGAIGILILHFIPDRTAQFVFLLIFMVGNFSFQRRNYVVSVILMTPFVLILFNLLGNYGTFNLVEERIIDTLIGSAIAFSASYFVFPSWESEQMEKFLKAMLVANANYLQKLAEMLAGKTVTSEDYKLARKQVYVHSANLSAAFQRMVSEPKNRQRKSKEVQKFTVLNHILSSYIATAASGLVNKEARIFPPDYQRAVKRSCALLHESARRLAPAKTTALPEPCPEKESPAGIVQSPEDEALQRTQLEFIQKISADIRKVTDEFLSEEAA